MTDRLEIPGTTDEWVVHAGADDVTGTRGVPMPPQALALAREQELEPAQRLPPESSCVTFYTRWVKPATDRALALIGLLVLLPLLLAIALLIRLSLGPPILFRQQRVGMRGRVFVIYKFRTMLPDRRASQRHWQGSERRRCHKTDEDPRHTRLGRILRGSSLDELPQLLNVLRGEMSIVGPRPELVSIVDTYADWQHRRHMVRPGITGRWQVTARGDGLMHHNTHLDLEYVERIGVLEDLRILLLTLPAVLGRRSG